MRSIQAIFWDYDNTIFETAESHWNKHLLVLSEHGIKLDNKFRQRVYENNGSQNWQWMHAELGLQLPEKEYLAAIDREFQRHLLSLSMRPGVSEVFSLANAYGIPQAIITNARRDSAMPVLVTKNILPIMKFVLFKEDYLGRKPEPTPYLTGFEKMSFFVSEKPLQPERCLAIEDDPKGVESAHCAGATVIHRKLYEHDANSPHADYCCFHEADFLRIMKQLLDA